MPLSIPEGLYQWAVPTSDIPNPGSPVFPNDFLSTPWYPSIADLSDASVIQTDDLGDLGAAYRFECALSAVSDPGFDTNHFVRVRAQKSDSGTQTLLMDLRQGGSSLHTWVLTLTAGLATYDEPLDPSVVAAISSYSSGLSLRGDAVHISSPNRVIVAAVRLGVPPVGFAHLLPATNRPGFERVGIASGSYARPAAAGFGWEIATGIEQVGALVSTDGASFVVKS